MLLVPNRIWVKVSLRCGIPITEEDLQHPGGFWHWVWQHNVPVTIVEGVKKAGALLTAGYAAIAISGVKAGYRTPQDEYGTAIGKPSLIPDLKYFATQGRLVNICFDQDNKPETVQRVRTAISRMGRLRSQHVVTQANIVLLSAADNDDYSFVDQNFQPESLQTWGKRGSVINAEMRCYRESVLRGLVEDGYTIIDAADADEDESGTVIESVKAASQELYAVECQAIANSVELSQTELKKLQDKRAKTKTERHQQRKAELSRRYEVDVTPELVEKDDDSWYPQLRMHYYLTLGREFLTTRDAKRAKAQLSAGENSIWKPDFNKGQLLPAVLLLENLNLLQFLTPDVQLRGSDEKMVEFKALAVTHRHVIKNYLNVSISEKLIPVAIAQKLLAKIDLKLDYVGRLGKRENRECVYQFVAPDDERNSIFEQWLNRDELFLSEVVSVTNNISTTTPVIDTQSQDIPQTLTPVESPTFLGWRGLKLKLRQGLNSVGQFYQQLVSQLGDAIGVADGEPFWNAYLGQWQVAVNFAAGCKSVVCDWLAVVG